MMIQVIWDVMLRQKAMQFLTVPSECQGQAVEENHTCNNTAS